MIGLLVGKDRELLEGAFGGNFDVVLAKVQGGAGVDGPPGERHPFPPIVAATIAKQVAIVDFLLKQGANPDKPAVELPMIAADRGERALHIAARTGQVDIVRVLLKHSGTNPNATDKIGRTPLFTACRDPNNSCCVEVVRLLLEAGADPTLAEERGYLPLHFATLHGDMDSVDMLCSAAPATLNRCASSGETPLFGACCNGHERMASKLLSLGAKMKIPPDEDSFNKMCPLVQATVKGFVGVVRVLVNEGGIGAFGGEEVLKRALFTAIDSRNARILQLLLTADGEERRPKWANSEVRMSMSLLGFSARRPFPAAANVLLKAGADETARDISGRTPLDILASDPDEDGEPGKDPEKKVAMGRMLQRGPAYRARSWAWPSDEAPNGGGGGNSDTTATADVRSSPPVVIIPPVVGVRIFRPKESSGGSKVFVKVIGRYCAKD